MLSHLTSMFMVFTQQNRCGQSRGRQTSSAASPGVAMLCFLLDSSIMFPRKWIRGQEKGVGTEARKYFLEFGFQIHSVEASRIAVDTVYFLKRVLPFPNRSNQGMEEWDEDESWPGQSWSFNAKVKPLPRLSPCRTHCQGLAPFRMPAHAVSTCESLAFGPQLSCIGVMFSSLCYFFRTLLEGPWEKRLLLLLVSHIQCVCGLTLIDRLLFVHMSPGGLHYSSMPQAWVSRLLILVFTSTIQRW